MTAHHLLLLGFIAAGTGAAATAQTYRAHGTEPFWDVTIGGGRIAYHSPDDQRIFVRTPPRRPIRNGYRYVTPHFRIDVTHVQCNDDMGDDEYADTVRVYFARGERRLLDGCGGAVVPPVHLANTAWSIVAIDDAAVSGDAYALDFGDDHRLNGQAGCNHFSGPFTETGRVLHPGAVVVTRMACPGPRMIHEQKLLRLLGGPVAFRYPVDGESVVLSGSGVTVRLTRQ